MDYRVLLKEGTKYLAQLDSLKHQARRIVSFLLRRVRIRSALVYVFEPSHDAYLLKASRPIVRRQELLRITQFHALIQRFYKDEGPLHLDELLGEEKTAKGDTALVPMIDLMKALKAEAAIPCFGGPPQPRQLKKHKQPIHLRGILFLGHQKSDEPFREEDLDVFFTLGQESSIAFENARLCTPHPHRLWRSFFDLAFPSCSH